MATSRDDRRNNHTAILAEVARATALPALKLDGYNVYELHVFIEQMKTMEKLTDEISSTSGVCAKRYDDDPGVYCSTQPGAVIGTVSTWAGHQITAAVVALEARAANNPLEQAFRMEALLGHYASNEDWLKCRQLLDEVSPPAKAPDTLDAQDRLNEGEALIQGAFLALSSPIFGDGKDDTNAVSETIYQGLAKLQAAKEALQG